MYSSLYGNSQSNLGLPPRRGGGALSSLGAGGNDTTSQRGGSRARSKLSTHSDPLSISGLEVNVRPLLDHNAKLLNGRLQVKKIISERSFIVYSEEFKEDLLLKAIPADENIQRWIDLPPHTNVATAFDQLSYEGKQFSLCECSNGGNMYQYIESLQLNLAINVPQSYIELIYDCAIQLAMGLDFAHSNGLVHGQFDLSNVVITKDIENLMFNITDFRPVTSMNMPLTSEGSLWPFARNKKKVSDAEKMELLMLKDIYALGICILEMMIGRVSTNKFSISLDSLPLTWAEFPESTPLIQVLVECINIDSITQRKGKLQNIKKLLIKDYKKFFQRPFYKMELPVVGKRTDVCNKKAIMALCRGEEDLALKYWEEAQQMKDEHFDTSMNYLIYKWRIAQLSDDQLVEELSKDVFKQKDIGQGWNGIIKMAIGDITDGSKILKAIVAEDMGLEREDELRNLKVQRFKQQVKEIVDLLGKESDKFPENKRVKSEHKEKIETITVNANSRFFTTVSKDSVKVWSITNGTQARRVISIPFEQADQAKGSSRLLAAVDPEGKNLLVYKGANFVFHLYSIDTAAGTFSLKDKIDLVKELSRVSQTEQKLDEFDVIAEMRILNDSKTLRIVQMRKKVPYMIDLNFLNYVPEVRKMDNHRFDDRSIYKYGLTYVQYHESLNKFVAGQLQKGNIIAFPEKEFQACIVLNREDKQNKVFQVYDIFGERFLRKVRKQETALRVGTEESDAFDVDLDGRVLIYCSGEELVLQTLRIPDPLHKHIRPRYNLALHKENPAKISSQRLKFTEKIIRGLRVYDALKLADDTLVKKHFENCLSLMLSKVELGFNNKRLINANQEFLKLQKIVLQNQIPGKIEVSGLGSIQKIGIFDEIKFANDLHRIRFIQLSSQSENNFMLITVDGSVYKYDLATRELLFSFKTQALKCMLLYGRDKKIVAADSQQMKLWEFQNQFDDAPELITVHQTPLKVDQVFVNCRGGAESYHVITCKEFFEVYDYNIDIVFRAQVPESDGGVIKHIEFDQKADHLYVSSDKGKVYKFNIAMKQLVGTSTLDIPSDSQTLEFMHCIHNHGLKGASETYFIAHSPGQLQFVEFEKKKVVPQPLPVEVLKAGEVCQLKQTMDARFFLMGVPQTSTFCSLAFNKQNQTLTLQKKIFVDGFRSFETDSLCTQIVFLNQKCRVLDFYAIKWDFEIKQKKTSVESIDEGQMEDELAQYLATVPKSTLNARSGLKSDPLATAIGGSHKTACCSIF